MADTAARNREHGRGARRRTMWRVSLGIALVAVPGGRTEAQPMLGLRDALARAESGAYASRMADGETAVQSAAVTASLRGVLPTIRAEAGYLRTTDPIGAFGTVMRQRRIEQLHFDPARLNHPAAVSNHTGALAVEQPLLNVDAHLGRRAASRAVDAAAAGAYWTRIGARVDVIRAYYAAVLATETVDALAAALEAARSHVGQAEAAVRAGTATPSDALLARVRAGEMEAQLIEARGQADLARRSLAIVLGTPYDTAFRLPDRLPPADRIGRLVAREPGTGRAAARADVQAARHGRDAARADVVRARSLHLPRINAFARFDWNSPVAPYSGDENWAVGVIASWIPFSGGAAWAERQAAAGRADVAQAALEAAEAGALVDIERATHERRVALARLDIAERAVAQAAEAHRIVTRKYEGGLATIAELLDAAAIATRTTLALSRSRWDVIVAEAQLLRALGHDPADIAGILDDGVEP